MGIIGKETKIEHDWVDNEIELRIKTVIYETKNMAKEINRAGSKFKEIKEINDIRITWGI